MSSPIGRLGPGRRIVIVHFEQYSALAIAQPDCALVGGQAVGRRPIPGADDVGNAVVRLDQSWHTRHDEISAGAQERVRWESVMHRPVDGETADVFLPWFGIEKLDELKRDIVRETRQRTGVVHDFGNHQTRLAAGRSGWLAV